MLAGSRCSRCSAGGCDCLVQPGAVAGRSLARDSLVRPHDPREVHPTRTRPPASRATRRRAPCRSPAASPTGRASGPPARRPRPTRSESVRGRRRSGAAWPRGPTSPLIPRDVDAAGDTLFQTYCAVCHGTAGDAQGPVSSRIGAPSLLTVARPGLHRRLHLQHHPLRARRHAALRRQGLPALRPLGDRESRAQAAGAVAGASEPPAAAVGIPPGAQRTARPEGAPMSRPPARPPGRSARSPAATTLFLGVGRRARDPRADPLPPGARSGGRRRPRLAALPRQLALLHRARGGQRRLRRRCTRSPTRSGRA